VTVSAWAWLDGGRVRLAWTTAWRGGAVGGRTAGSRSGMLGRRGLAARPSFVRATG
jgi:hypothetical protein